MAIQSSMDVLRSFGGRSSSSCAPSCSCLTPLRRLAFHCENGDCRQFLSNRSISIFCDLATSTIQRSGRLKLKGYESLSASQIPWAVSEPAKYLPRALVAQENTDGKQPIADNGRLDTFAAGSGPLPCPSTTLCSCHPQPLENQ